MPKARKNRAGRNNTLRRLEYDLHVAAIYDHNAIIGEEATFDGEYELLVHDRLWSALPAPSTPVAAYQGSSFRPRISLEEYVNSKFVYVEKHVKHQLTRLYNDIMEQKCALERQILQNALSLSAIAPDEMAYRVMKSPGYTAVTAGEVIHIIQCVPVTRKGTHKDCNELLPNMYQLNDAWYKLTTKPSESLPPPVIQPLSTPRWKYVSPDALATSGIYSADDLDRLRDHIMFPVEKPSTLNTIARGALGQNIPGGSISLANLLDEEALDKIAESAGKRIWKGFITFGSASAGVLAIFVIARMVKLIIDTIIHGYALHRIYGWSIHLLGAVWSSITNLLLHMAKPTNQPDSPSTERLMPHQAADKPLPATAPQREETEERAFLQRTQ